MGFYFVPPLWINRKRKTDSVPSLKLTAGLPLKLENQICWKITFPFAAKGLFSAVNRQSYFWKFCGTSREPTNDELIKRNHNMNFFWDSKSAKKMQKKTFLKSKSFIFPRFYMEPTPNKNTWEFFFRSFPTIPGFNMEQVSMGIVSLSIPFRRWWTPCRKIFDRVFSGKKGYKKMTFQENGVYFGATRYLHLDSLGW